MLEVAFTAVSATVDPQPPELSSAGFGAVSPEGASPVAGAMIESHAEDSVGTDGSTFSLLREPFVCAAEAPRALPPRPRSTPRPRLPPPLAPSNPARPPRETREVWFEGSGRVVSLAFDLERSFFAFGTSPHGVIEPAF
jgi:hypothetical protein